ncbi:tetratricopeptide repeat protein [Nannocystis pusilla]|uniref:Tetratricopeptide repeat protein n=1 Tax=Nannocystis pusilla TaxID=889268 RepID=A0ABS7TNC1_9BACT|nr:tetratricopeptide repeat protein [Nannocystis pusilla]
MYLDRQQTAMALEPYERAAITIEKALDPKHPGVAGAMVHLGDLHLERNDLERAEHYFTRALEITEAARGPDHLDNAWSLGGLGEIAEHRGRSDEAVRRIWNRSTWNATQGCAEHRRQAAGQRRDRRARADRRADPRAGRTSGSSCAGTPASAATRSCAGTRTTASSSSSACRRTRA